MWGIPDLILLSVALAMDCFTVSMVDGVIVGRREWRLIGVTAFLFGFFQAFMPLLGWLATTGFVHYIEDYDHWVAFLLLAFLGIRMILEAGEPEEAQHFNPRKTSTQLLQAVATSIDALAVGISMSVTGYATMESLALPMIIIGVGSFLFAVAGYLLGTRYGHDLRRRLKPEILGGIILLFIGIKILFSHLWDL